MTNNAEREGFEKWISSAEIEKNTALYFAAWNGWLARAQASGVPDKKVYGDYEADQGGYLDAYASGHMDGWNACREAMLATAPTPPKVASVPVERLAALKHMFEKMAPNLIQSQKTCYQYAAEKLAEIITEYKS
jgi:hypothetical protein